MVWSSVAPNARGTETRVRQGANVRHNGGMPRRNGSCRAADFSGQACTPDCSAAHAAGSFWSRIGWSRIAFRSRRARRARPRSRGLAGFRSGAGRERGTWRGWRFDRIGIASVGPRRAKQAILALHEHLRLASGLAVALGKVDGHLQGFPFGWIRTRVAIAGANFPFALALGDEILGTGHRDLPAGDERGRDAATTPAAPNRSSGKQNRPQEIPGPAPDRFC